MLNDHVCGISAVPIPKQRHIVQVPKAWHLLGRCGHLVGHSKYNYVS